MADVSFKCESVFLEDTMKKFVIAAAISVVATSAFAGGMSEPVMEMAPMMEEASSSSASGILLPILLLALVAAAVSAN